jgi:hypothetical protein
MVPRWLGWVPRYGTGPRRRGSRLSRIHLSGAQIVVAVVVVVFTGLDFLGESRYVPPSTTFASGERVTVRLDPANDPMIYASGEQLGRYSCDLSGPGPEGLSLTEAAPIQSSKLLNGVLWFNVQYVEVPAPDEYQVTCEGEDLRFGVGPGPPRFLNSLLMRLLMLAAFVATLTLVIMTIVRDRFGRRSS